MRSRAVPTSIFCVGRGSGRAVRAGKRAEEFVLSVGDRPKGPTQLDSGPKASANPRFAGGTSIGIDKRRNTAIVAHGCVSAGRNAAMACPGVTAAKGATEFSLLRRR
jgi:hypothetical protein